MMKTKEELNALKSEIEALNKKLAELNEEELEQVVGGVCGENTDNYYYPPKDDELNPFWYVAPDEKYGGVCGKDGFAPCPSCIHYGDKERCERCPYNPYKTR